MTGGLPLTSETFGMNYETPSKLYREAHRVHYELQDMDKARACYLDLIARYPDSEESGYSRTQLANIEERELTIVASKERLEAKPAPEPNLRILMTTAPSIDGYVVEQTLEIVASECAFGMNLFRDFFAGMTDIFGGRSLSTQKVLRDARRACLRELRGEAESIGANAVIGVSLSYSEFSGQGKSMLFLAASGTAVIVRDTRPSEPDFLG